LLASLALAKLYQSTARPADAHAALAPALEGFSPTPEMPEIAEAQALLAALAESGEVKAAVARREWRVKLQTAYGQALMWTKGYASEEAKDAFARAREMTGGTDDAAELFSAYYARFVRSYVRAEWPQARATAEAFLRDAEEGGCATEACAARRCLGAACLLQGDLREARALLERALADYAPDRDAPTRFRFGMDTGVMAAAHLALAMWPLGEVERARQLGEQAIQRAAELGHAPTSASMYSLGAVLDAERDEPAAALRSAEMAHALGREHGMDYYVPVGGAFAGWARGRLHDPEVGAQEFRQALAEYSKQGNKACAPLFHGMLAQLETATRGPDAALTLIDQGLAIAAETGERFTDPYLHRLRGTILLSRDPANPGPAEEAFQTAIAIAKQQGARSYELLASLSLAKLQSAARPAEAHAVLAPALEGFSPTPEMPEIAEARTVLAALAETDEVKSAAASRQRRLELQTRYGQAMTWSRGFGSDESMTAFARARTLAAGVDNASERFDAYNGLFTGSLLRGELSLARETAESFLRDAENTGRMTEASVACRCVGFVRLFQGDFIDARSNLAEALQTYDPERDRDAKFRFGMDTGACATGFLALTHWALGDVERARALSGEAMARADETAHAPTRATVYHHISLYHMLRGDPESVICSAKILVDLSREHGMALFLAYGEVYSTWERARLDDRETGVSELLRPLAAYVDQGNKLHAPLFQGRLAEVEAEGDGAEEALRRIDEALALAKETGGRWTEALLHRIRGEIQLKRDPANPAPAEEAFLAAIAIAQAQKARSFELQAALALAKLYQSIGRPAGAHAVLAPALEGFAPTPEMPEIAEAQALLAALAETEERGLQNAKDR
jgi:predicted ATPase